MNKIQIAGYIGKDPEYKELSNGAKVFFFSVSDKLMNKNKDTLWWKVNVWSDRANLYSFASKLKKGDGVVVYGAIVSPVHVYQNREGKHVASMEMTALDISFSPFGRKETKQEQDNLPF